MSRVSAAQMLLPMSDSPDDSGGWDAILLDAFADRERRSGFLPLAEAALRANPGDPMILYLAATAAVLDEHPDRALVFLKRFSKRYVPTMPYHLLHALALAQQNKPAPARVLLERYGLMSLHQAMPAFPGGWARSEWLSARLVGIFHRSKPAARMRAPAGIGRAPAKPASKPVSKSRPAERPAPAPAAAAEVPAAPAGLPRIEIDIPFAVELDLAPLVAAAANGKREYDGGWFELRERFAHLGLAQGFDELLCLPQLHGIETFWYQVETVRKVLKQFRGRVLLADEVGLGKTIEAGMVLKEYLLRGMVERVPGSGIAGRTVARGARDQIRHSLRNDPRCASARRS